MLGPVPRWLVRCMWPFLPSRHRPSPQGAGWVGYHNSSASKRLHAGPQFRGRRHYLRSGLQVCLPPRSSPPLPLTMRSRAQGGRGVYIRAERDSLPPHASNMLAVRIGQLTARGLPPRKTRSLVDCSPLEGAFDELSSSCSCFFFSASCRRRYSRTPCSATPTMRHAVPAHPHGN